MCAEVCSSTRKLLISSSMRENPACIRISGVTQDSRSARIWLMRFDRLVCSWYAIRSTAATTSSASTRL